MSKTTLRVTVNFDYDLGPKIMSLLSDVARDAWAMGRDGKSFADTDRHINIGFVVSEVIRIVEEEINDIE